MDIYVKVNFLILIHITTFGLFFGEEVIKCLKETQERIRISCPRDHVIYNPIVIGGAGQDGSCDRSATDCTGMTSSLQRQIDRCFWRKKCFIKVGKSDIIPSCSGNVTSLVTYVIIKQAFCLPKKSIVDMCRTPTNDFSWKPGLIRSHRLYPRSKPSPIKCSITIPIKMHETLYMETVTRDGTFPPGLCIKAMTHSGFERSINKTELYIIHGNETRSVRLMADIKRSRKYLQGFAIQVTVYRTKHVNAVLQWPRTSWPVITELGMIRDVKPVIEQCAAGTKGHMTLTCDADEVIYSPAISLSGYSPLIPKCSFVRRFKCGGFSVELLVQRNGCYWKQTCDVTWRQSDRIILSKEPECIGYYASTIGLAGHRCVKKSNIFDVCTANRSRVNESWAVIRSHAGYPWYFDDIRCKRVITIGGRHAGVLIVQDMNLDPDGRDNFTVEHVTKSQRRTVMYGKSSKEGTKVVVRGGRLIIHFKPYKSSKSGRGFILVFRRFHVSKAEFDGPFLGIPGMQKSSSTALLNDEAPVMTHSLSNRRLCSLKGKRRKQGKACNRRVWTDYFIRLE